MEGLGCVLLVVVIVAAWFAFDDARRRRQHEEIVKGATGQREEAMADDAARSVTALWLAIRDFFPYLPTPQPSAATAEAIGEAVTVALSSLPRIGTFGDKLPVPGLPNEERRRHLYIVGKTGSGKTTFLEHLIARDLAEGKGVGVVAPEGELFRTRLLPLVPRARRNDVLYVAPGDDACPVTLNPLAVEPGDDPARAADDLFTIMRRSLADDEFGPRMQPILHNGLAALTGRAGSTLADLKRLLEDDAFRYEVAATTDDEYVRTFWLETYPRFPKGADLPITNRLDQFLRPPPIRRMLCHPESSFSLREVLAEGRILFFDLYGLGEGIRLLFGQLLLSKLQLELMRRELAGASPAPFHLYCDEFQAVAGLSEGVWRELLSRGRKYGLSLTLANQYPSQLPAGIQNEIFGNVNSLVAFALGNKDAQVVRKELLGATVKNGKERREPIPAEDLLELPIGWAIAKLAGGRAIRFRTLPPLAVSPGATKAVISESWRRYGAKRLPETPASKPKPAPKLAEPESFLE